MKIILKIVISLLTIFSLVIPTFNVFASNTTKEENQKLLYSIENIESSFNIDSTIVSNILPQLNTLLDQNLPPINNNITIPKQTTIHLDKRYYNSQDMKISASDIFMNTFLISDSSININTSNLLASEKDNFSILYSRNGDINIDASNINFNGIIYAPNGTVNIKSANTNINGLIIANKIILNSNNFNISNNIIADRIINNINQIELNYKIENNAIIFNWNNISTTNMLYTSIDSEEFKCIYNGTKPSYAFNEFEENTTYEFKAGIMLPFNLIIYSNSLCFEKNNDIIELVEPPINKLEPLPSGVKIYEKELSPENIVTDTLTGDKYVKNQILLTSKKGFSFEQVADLIGPYQGEIVGYISPTNDYQIEFKRNYTKAELENICLMLEYNPNIETVLIHKVFTDSSKNSFSDESSLSTKEATSSKKYWGFDAINAQYIWDVNEDWPLEKVKVGIIDGGFYNHKDLHLDRKDIVGYKSSGYFFPKLPKYYHGTMIAGIIAANTHPTDKHKTDLKGVAPNAELYAGIFEINMTQSFTLKRLIAGQIVRGVKVINISMADENTHRYYGDEKEYNRKKLFWDKLMSKFLYNFIDEGYEFIIVTGSGNLSNKRSEDKEWGWADTNYSMYFKNLNNGIYDNYIYEAINNRIIVAGSIDLEKDFTYSISEFCQIGERVDVVAQGEKVTSLYKGKKTKCDSGTSYSTPFVTGVTAAVWGANPSLSSKQVKDIIIKSGEDNKIGIKPSDINPHVKNYLLGNSNLTKKYPLVNAKKALELAGRGQGVKPPKKNVVIGKVDFSAIECDFEKNDDIIIYPSLNFNIQKNDGSGNQIVKTATSDNFGEFSFILPDGRYIITLASDSFTGYVNKEIKTFYTQPFSYEFKVSGGEFKYLEKIKILEKSSSSKIYSIDGKITNALTGNPIKDAKITFSKNWLINSSSENVTNSNNTITTDSNGDYKINLQTGYYTATVSKDGFVSSTFYVSVYKKNKNKYNCSISPKLNKGEMRIVLTWGSTPSDLDSHLIAVRPDNKQFAHVYYSNKQYINNTESIVLDVDDTSSYGPETITIAKPLNGKFVYSILNYSKNGVSGLSNSIAKITVITDKGVEKIFNVPLNKKGYVWNVFEYDGKSIKVINTIDFEYKIPSYPQKTKTQIHFIYYKTSTFHQRSKELL